MSDPLDIAGENPWRTERRHVIYDNGRMRLREDAVVQPNGARGTYSFVEIPWPIVAVVPL